MDRKLIFLDIDGTLLPPGDMLVPESTLRTLEQAKANGHKLFLCTGRNYRAAAPARLLCRCSVQRRRLCALRR